MSFDKQNFARTVQEQQAGISPQMWPIMCRDNGSLVLNQPYEISINPCDCVWLPYTYDKSYGVNPGQLNAQTSPFLASPAIAGANVSDVRFAGKNPVVTTFSWAPLILAPIFGLRFNSPNNPWLLWGLGDPTLVQASGAGRWGSGAPPDGGLMPIGGSTLMRSITGPISRLWIQYYQFALTIFNAAATTPTGLNQIVLMSMAGFSQQSFDRRSVVVDDTADPVLLAPPPLDNGVVACGGYHTTDLNSADLNALHQNPMPSAPTTSGKGSTT